jgi:hypothetical protein
MPLRNRLLVNPDLPRHHAAFGCPSAQHRTFHQVPRFVPTGAQDHCRLFDVRRPQHVYRQHLKQVREPASCFRPRQLRLPDTVRRTVDSRRFGVQVRQKLATVQMPTHPFSMVVIHRQFLPAFRTAKPASLLMFHMHVHPLFGNVQFYPLHRPRTPQPQQTSIQILAFHRTPLA